MKTTITPYDSLVAALMAGDIGDAALHIAKGEKAHQVYELSEGKRVTLLHLMADDSKYDVVVFLLQNGAVINYEDYQGRTALFQPAAHGDERMVTLLLTYGADPNIRDALLGYTPLHAAAVHDRGGVVKVLLGFGADAGARDNKGITPLILAAHGGHRGTAELLGSGRVTELLRNQLDDARRANR